MTPARRTLQFNSLDDILTDARTVTASEHHTTNNWNAAQNIDHVARMIELSIDGFEITVPFPLRLIGKLVFRPKWLKKGFTPGTNPPSKIARYFAPREGVTLEQAMQKLEEQIQRAKDQGMHQPSPLLGPLSHDEWDTIQRRHAEMHFSFIHPGTSAE